MFSHFNRIHERERRTDGQTNDRHTETSGRAYSIASRGKNLKKCRTECPRKKT